MSEGPCRKVDAICAKAQLGEALDERAHCWEGI